LSRYIEAYIEALQQISWSTIQSRGARSR